MKKSIDEVLLPRVVPIVHAIQQRGGHAYLVGGVVRDLIRQVPNHTTPDYDIELHGLTGEQLAQILAQFGPVREVGVAFGVFKIDGIPVDWSLPRTDNSGRKPLVEINPHLSIRDALSRRDVTINACALDLQTAELIDPFGGAADIERGVLRAVDPHKFGEDPLRLYRVMQFIGRFSTAEKLFWPDDQLNELCRTMSLTGIAWERIAAELNKLFTQGVRPSYGLRWLQEIERLAESMAEIAALVGVPQAPDWHPEGDVFEHTMQALDALAGHIQVGTEHRILLMYATLCHDIGKPSKTVWHNNRWRSIGHDHAGAPIAERLVKRMTGQPRLAAQVGRLVYHHMAPGTFIKNNAGKSAYKRLAFALGADLSLEELSLIAYADRAGRNSAQRTPLCWGDGDITEFRARAERAGVLHGPEAPVLTGKDVLDLIAPGPTVGKALAYAYEIQLNELITDKELLRSRVIKRFRTP